MAFFTYKIALDAVNLRVSALIKSAFLESDEGNDDGADIEAFADYTADGEVVDVMYYPERGDNCDLGEAYGLAVSRPHGEGSNALSYQHYSRHPPFLSKEERRGEAGCKEGGLHQYEVDGMLTFIAQGEDDSAQYAENVQKHTDPRVQKQELQGERYGASHLQKEVGFVFLALVGEKRASGSYVADQLYRR